MSYIYLARVIDFNSPYSPVIFLSVGFFILRAQNLNP